MPQLFYAPATRTDLRRADGRLAIERAAERALQRSGYLSVRNVRCCYSDGVLTLRGRLPSFFLKQMAQCAVARRLRDEAIVDNQLEVLPPRFGATT